MPLLLFRDIDTVEHSVDGRVILLDTHWDAVLFAYPFEVNLHHTHRDKYGVRDGNAPRHSVIHADTAEHADSVTVGHVDDNPDAVARRAVRDSVRREPRNIARDTRHRV